MSTDKTEKSTQQRSANARFNAHHEHTASDETDKAITFINSQDLGWKADVCKLQKQHADYGDHCQAQEDEAAQTLAQTAADVDLDENHKAKDFSKSSGKDFDEALKKA